MQLGACLFLMKSSGCARLFSHGQAWMEKWIVVQMRRRGEKKVNWFCWPSVYEGWSRLRWHTSGWIVGNKIYTHWLAVSGVVIRPVNGESWYPRLFILFSFARLHFVLQFFVYVNKVHFQLALLSFPLCPKLLTRWMSHSYPTERGEEEAEWCIQHRWADSPRGLFYL